MNNKVAAGRVQAPGDRRADALGAAGNQCSLAG
jgi:hypothetical protein